MNRTRYPTSDVDPNPVVPGFIWVRGLKLKLKLLKSDLRNKLNENIIADILLMRANLYGSGSDL